MCGVVQAHCVASSGNVYWNAAAKDAWGNLTGETYGSALTGTHQSSTGQLRDDEILVRRRR
jgi:hypothetical protein